MESRDPAQAEGLNPVADVGELFGQLGLCNFLKERRLGISIKLVEEVSVDEQFFSGI
jgi:hypothetical protein